MALNFKQESFSAKRLNGIQGFLKQKGTEFSQTHILQVQGISLMNEKKQSAGTNIKIYLMRIWRHDKNVLIRYYNLILETKK